MSKVEKIQPADHDRSAVDGGEYKILFNWYSEWVRICRLLTTFAFGSIGFTMLVFDLKGKPSIPEDQISLLKTSWIFLGIGGLLGGLSIMLAYIWLDSFSRARMPSLIGKIVFSKPFHGILKVGFVGWVVSVIAAISILLGLYFFISAAWIAL